MMGEGGNTENEGGGGGGIHEVGGSSSLMSASGSGGDFFDGGDRSNTGGNRWPKQETLDLLKIRFDMDAVFRDSPLKAPLWDDVSRKMAELGYHRSAKKCREKFENVYKYHKRTKDGRVGKSEGKNYIFFEQLEALEFQYQQSHPPLPLVTPRSEPQPHPAAQDAVPVRMVIPAGTNPGGVTVTSSPHGISQAHHYQVNLAPIPHQQSYHQQHSMGVHHGSPIQMENVSSPSGTLSSSSSTSSDEELVGRRKRKRKWKEFFERKMKEVIDKQEELQKRFFAAVEERERERLVKEEAWKAQEMNRLKREHEILAHERSTVAAKDAALIEILKKISDQQQIPLSLPIEITQTQIQTQSEICGAPPVITSTATTITRLPPSPPQPLQTRQELEPSARVAQVHVQEKSFPVATPIPPPQPPPQSQPKLEQQALVRPNTTVYTNVELQRPNNGSGESQHQVSPSRWPKAEVEALINLRTKMDQKYQENGPKGPLWEEISSLMKNIGYNRNAKRCKEKWENINKYFKKVKESNKKRPEDSKTCPYFHQLDALYQQKTSITNPSTNVVTTYNGGSVKLENLNAMDPIMAQPEQQWRGGQDHAMANNVGSDSDSEGDGEDDDDGDDQESGGYEIVPNNNGGDNVGVNSSATTTTSTSAAQ